MAALGEETKGDIFCLTLGNLPTGGNAVVSLSLVGELSVQSSDQPASFRFTLPSVLKPRYTPVGTEPSLHPIEGDNVARGCVGFKNFKLSVQEGSKVDSVTSPTHELSTATNGNLFVAHLKDMSKPITKDLVLCISYKEPHSPRVIVEEAMSNGSSSSNDFMSSAVAMLDFFPKFLSTQAACEFIFLIDRSGSMGGSYIKSAADTLILFLRSIPPGCFFNVIGFGSTFSSLFKESVPYDQVNLDIAIKHVESLEADLGGTELFSPLKHIFGLELVNGLPRQIFVLTDGAVDDTSACIDLARKNKHLGR